jgi:DNA sulfur modification protein DndC
MQCATLAPVNIDLITSDLKDAYLDVDFNFPWIVGYSGGKDSTLVVHLLFDMLMSIPPKKRTKPVYIISNDTLVESPLVCNHMTKTLGFIEEAARNLKLPIYTSLTIPDKKQTFWTLLIGKGYPPPNLSMRWCTDRLKIKPTSKFVLDHVKKSGNDIIVLGVRKDESNNRKRSIEKYENSNRYSQHSSLTGAFVYSPIVNITTEEVWNYLWHNDPLWGGTHEELISIYKEADAGECPLVVSKDEAPSCGTNSSRFGCWVCTVVTNDRSLQAVVDGGRKEYLPLIEFRTWLLDILNDPEWRQARRRNGKVSFSANGSHIPGPFTIKARKKILEELLSVQNKVGFELISQDEINIIHQFWAEDMNQEIS